MYESARDYCNNHLSRGMLFIRELSWSFPINKINCPEIRRQITNCIGWRNIYRIMGVDPKVRRQRLSVGRNSHLRYCCISIEGTNHSEKRTHRIYKTLWHVTIALDIILACWKVKAPETKTREGCDSVTTFLPNVDISAFTIRQ
jgi:hypothetical protein